LDWFLNLQFHLFHGNPKNEYHVISSVGLANFSFPAIVSTKLRWTWPPASGCRFHGAAHASKMIDVMPGQLSGVCGPEWKGEGVRWGLEVTLPGRRCSPLYITRSYQLDKFRTNSWVIFCIFHANFSHHGTLLAFAGTAWSRIGVDQQNYDMGNKKNRAT